MEKTRVTVAIAAVAGLLCQSAPAWSAGPTTDRIERQIQELREENKRNYDRIEELEHELKAVKNQNAQLQKLSTQLQANDEQTTQQMQNLTQKVESNVSPGSLQGFLDSYWGQHRFVVTGYATGTFEYDRNNSNNTFAAGFNPIILYRLSDWISFEGELEIKLPSDAETEVNLEYAHSDVFLNDHMQLAIGKMLTPFGDFIEDLHPAWINRMVSFPLPYREETGLMPFSATGLQIRGGAEWGAEGQDLDYSVIFANTPAFEEPGIVGSPFTFNNIKTNTNGIAYGGRLRVYPLPLDAEIGRLEFGVSTYNGKWLDGNWFTSWGIDTAYHVGPFEFRGEYLETARQMPAPASADNRQGWYVQAGYQLYDLHFTPDIDRYLSRLELVARYSGQNQRAVVIDPEEPIIPGNGTDVSPSLLAPHAREVALGIDYWIAPSVVWKLEYDIELPNNGGFQIAPDGIATPASAQTDRALITQFAIGF